MNHVEVKEQERLALWRVIRAGHELHQRVEATLRDIGLSLSKLEVLRTLAAEEQGLPMCDLAAHRQCTRSNITQLVDRLEAEGLVRRVDDPQDRRVCLTELTDAGRETWDRASKLIRRLERETAESLDAADSAALARALDRLTS